MFLRLNSFGVGIPGSTHLPSSPVAVVRRRTRFPTRPREYRNAPMAHRWNERVPWSAAVNGEGRRTFVGSFTRRAHRGNPVEAGLALAFLSIRCRITRRRPGSVVYLTALSSEFGTLDLSSSARDVDAYARRQPFLCASRVFRPAAESLRTAVFSLPLYTGATGGGDKDIPERPGPPPPHSKGDVIRSSYEFLRVPDPPGPPWVTLARRC